jgi:predicted dehydrogenase
MSAGEKRPIRLGILGLSEGNGHPYSWSAICNGYDRTAMDTCPFPVIPQYLALQKFPEDALTGVKVTHVWTENKSTSEHVAAAALIPIVVDDFREMIGNVDGILLARDDAERHVEMSLPFIDAGIPIYIDKPIATHMKDLRTLISRQKYRGQLFSCSALRYSQSLALDDEARALLGEVRHVDAVVPKYWSTYGVHLVDPILENLGLYGAPCTVSAEKLGGVQVVSIRWPSVSATLTCLGSLPGDIRLRFYGTNGKCERVFTDTYYAFKTALGKFVASVATRSEVTTPTEFESVVSILERGSV